MAEHFSPEEIEEYKECFSLYDRDGDGLITNDQLKLVLRSLEQCPTQMDINAISSVSGKTKVSFPELLDILLDFKTKFQGSWKDEIIAAFKAHDNNKFGHVAMDDLKHVMMKTGEKLSTEEFEYMLYQAGISKSSSKVDYIVLAEAFAHS